MVLSSGLNESEKEAHTIDCEDHDISDYFVDGG
jgi:hypothetical protein